MSTPNNQIELSVLSGATGLVKSHEVSADSETTIMRSIDEIVKLDNFLTKKAMSCDNKAQAMKSLFAFRGVPRNYVP